MELLLLGSGAGELWPSAFCPCAQCRSAIAEIGRGSGRLRTGSCLLVDRTFLFDLPPNSAAAAIRLGVSLAEVTDLFVTHSHQDHLDPGILAAAGRTPQRPLRMYCNRRVAELLPSYGHFNRFFDPARLGLEIRVLTPSETVPEDEHGFVLRALAADHDRYGGEEPLIYQFERNGKRLLYACDTGWFCDEVWAQVEGWRYDAVVLECTFHVLRECRRGHLDLESFTAVIDRLRDAGAVTEQTVLVAQHLAHAHGTDGPAPGMLEQALAERGVTTAHDGLRIEL
jgi:phosphoribosyl 1,2-cyclic phosphodiesterase